MEGTMSGAVVWDLKKGRSMPFQTFRLPGIEASFSPSDEIKVTVERRYDSFMARTRWIDADRGRLEITLPDEVGPGAWLIHGWYMPRPSQTLLVIDLGIEVIDTREAVVVPEPEGTWRDRPPLL